jgi:hypothetical protein
MIFTIYNTMAALVFSQLYVAFALGITGLVLIFAQGTAHSPWEE